MPVGLERYAPQHEQSGQLAAFVRRGMVLGNAITAGVVLALALASPWLAGPAFAAEAGATAGGGSYLLQLALACLAVTLLLSAYFNVQGVLRGLRMYRALSAMEILHGLGFFVFGIAGLVLAGNLRFADWQVVRLQGSAVTVVLAYGASLLAPCATVGLGLRRHLARWPGQDRPLDSAPRQSAARLLRFSAFITGANIAWTVFMLFGLWLVNKLHGQAEAGLLAVPRDLVQAVQLLAMAIWPTAQNSAAHLWEQGRRRDAINQLAVVFRISGWLVWLLAAGLVLARGLIERMLPHDYAGAAALVPWLLIMFLYMIHFSLPNAHAYLLERTNLLLLAAGAGLAVHVATAAWLAPSGRALGAAQSAAIGAAAAVAVLLSGIRLSAGWSGRRRPGDRSAEAAEMPRLAPRESLLLLAPGALAIPAVWPIGGDIVLAALAVATCLLIVFTGRLWTHQDRLTFAGYLRASWKSLTRKR